MSKYTRDEFIEKARKRHGDKYDYSQVDYVDSQTKVAIVCHEKDVLGNEHGIFWQMPYSHLQGFRCPRCNGRKKTTEQWVAEAMAVYPEGKYTFEIYSSKGARKTSSFLDMNYENISVWGKQIIALHENECTILNERGNILFQDRLEGGTLQAIFPMSGWRAYRVIFSDKTVEMHMRIWKNSSS